MIIVKAPYRISFLGGGTDYKEWYQEYGGEVLTSTINKHCYICLRQTPPFLGYLYRIFWAKYEAVNSLSEIQHPGVRGCLEYLNIAEGIEVNHAGDLPSRSGLGSSSAFTVGMLHALHTMRNEKINKAQLAKQAIDVEQVILKENVGIQDQIQCAWGGINRIKIDQNGEYTIQPLILNEKVIQDHLIIFFTDIQRTASDIALDQINHIQRNKSGLKEIMELVSPAVEALKESNMMEFGRLLHESWMRKRKLSTKITSDSLDEIYELALRSGAYGGKILGAGGGGFFLFVVPPEKRQKLINALGLLYVDVEFDHEGSQVVI